MNEDGTPTVKKKVPHDIVDIATQIAVALCRNTEYVRAHNGQTGYVAIEAVRIAKSIIIEAYKDGR